MPTITNSPPAFSWGKKKISHDDLSSSVQLNSEDIHDYCRGRANSPPTSRASPFLILAPAGAVSPNFLHGVIQHTAIHSRIFSQMQVMRGAVALAEGAIQACDLDSGARHHMPGDSESWHLLRMGDDGQIRGCARILMHSDNPSFHRLRLSSSRIAKSEQWGQKVRFAVEAEMARATASGMKLVEPGGWVLRPNLRGGPDAISLALSAFAWSQLMGGCLAFVTATLKHGSCSMLKRLGGSLLSFAGEPIPRYYDPEYRCEMELLSLYTKHLNPRFDALIAQVRKALIIAPVLQSGPVDAPVAARLA